MLHETPYFANEGRATTIYAAKTARRQNAPLHESGLTIITYVRAADQYQLLSACARLAKARDSFRSFGPTLHLTIAGVSSDDQPEGLTDKQREQIEQVVSEVMREELASIPQFVVSLKGIWPGGATTCPGANVVALADEASRQYIKALEARLHEKMKPRLEEIHQELKPKPARGVKVTLGFFNEPEDFRVDQELALALEELCRVKTDLLVERVALVRFRYKSLENAETIHEVQLSPPAGPPVRRETARPKVLPRPHWLRWTGISYLWDNPGKSLAVQADSGLSQIACEPWTDSELSLYRALNDALAEVGLKSAVNPLSFCPLSSTSYHVTAWDGFNEENLGRISEPEREKLGEFLLGLPQSAKRARSVQIPEHAFDAIKDSGPARFRFDHLKIWKDSVLVARLAAADEATARVLEQVSEIREQLDERFAPLGRARSFKYAPHITLGYFTHPGGGRAAADDLLRWELTFHKRAEGCLLAMRSISAYGFESMQTFLKLEFA